ncbi:hypothetical protein NBO_81g0009 [Nosema bombycis CQ1]|uniref:Uncharacterized protein n=1 Tax=Nosema bombycis (strain CQ1 / CVCC 102059) TaxID=578461 RepID=R0KRE5_NOSB1|nr:hypothetical protein NBO_81g0009 [Nosema bombycis CQ1]|eukprot:EOB13316.1 hypothetical protein NBO_81g0009 [Nosema bombycis CQ1]
MRLKRGGERINSFKREVVHHYIFMQNFRNLFFVYATLSLPSPFLPSLPTYISKFC